MESHSLDSSLVSSETFHRIQELLKEKINVQQNRTSSEPFEIAKHIQSDQPQQMEVEGTQEIDDEVVEDMKMLFTSYIES